MIHIVQLINEAWTHESNDDNEVASRLYKMAFNNILDLNLEVNASNSPLQSTVSPFEIRSVADYINHRSCHLQFSSNKPREAIAQFKRYLDTFKQHTKSPEYAFEHAAWLSQQYLMFADQFHQAVSSGVKASRTQHPGYYYYEAAMQMIDKRQNVTEYTNDTIRSNQMPVTVELLAMITTNSFASFLRQCGWTCVDASNGPPMDPHHTKQDNMVQSRKMDSPNYSEPIIRALYKAIEYFKIDEFSRARMQNFISVMIADEYKSMLEFKKAQTLYSKAMPMYDGEKWQILSQDIVAKLSQVEPALSDGCQARADSTVLERD